MKIVVEYVLLANFLINFIILKTTALVLNQKGRLFMPSALITASLTVCLPLFKLSAWGCFLLLFGWNMVIVCISFKFKTLKKFSQIYICFMLATFVYGGVCSLVASYIQTKSLILLMISVIIAYLAVKFLAKKIFRKKAIENFCYDVAISFSGKKSNWMAFLDSGNLLIDPLTNSPVSLINFKVFSSIFKDIELEDVLKKSDKLKQLQLAHYVCFGTMGQGNKVLVFQVDSLEIGSACYEKAILGLSLKDFNKALGSDIILNNNFAFMCNQEGKV